MAQDTAELSGPDLTKGIPESDIASDGTLLGRVGEEQVLLVRQGTEIFAVGAFCTHYHGPLADGVAEDGVIRCPWHHACFDLRTGEALHAPAFDPITCWKVERHDGNIIVAAKQDQPAAIAGRSPATGASPEKIVIVGGGAAGFAAAEMLRRNGYDRSLVMLSADDSPPCDRPNLSKDYLAGNAQADWIPLRPDNFYADNDIALSLNANVEELDLRNREVVLGNGRRVPYDRLLLATGAEPVRLTIPGADQPHVHTLRSLRDSSAIIADAERAKRAVVIGASFIGLEVAAALRAREIEVHVVAPDKRPLERVFGPEMGDFVRALHEEHGVIFHLQNQVSSIDGKRVSLTNGTFVDADLVVAGIGVRPRLALAEKAGLALDRGIAVNEFLQTSVPEIFAAGDIARWPDPHSGQHIRVEHWVVAERQGQIAAHNLLGERQKFSAVPFFWSQHYDVPINYVGHAEGWDRIDIEGDIPGRDCVLRYIRDGRTMAVASIYRDVDSLKAEIAMEHEKRLEGAGISATSAH